jgi:hypothetical protein
MTNNRSGLGLPAIIGIIALVLLIGASLLLDDDEEESPYATPEELQQYQQNVVGRPEAQKPINYSGQVLAGRASPLLQFNRPDYDKAIAAGKLIFVYFTSSTCGRQCETGINEAKKAFNQLNRNDVVGFVADLSDPVKAEAGVASADAKVLVRDGRVLLKDPLSWNAQAILGNIDAFTVDEEN